MLETAEQGIRSLSQAKIGDKSLVDTLFPATESYNIAVEEGKGFGDALDAMVAAAQAGRDSTRDLVSKIGRSSRLGERYAVLRPREFPRRQLRMPRRRRPSHYPNSPRC